jgi:hypothetical protein
MEACGETVPEETSPKRKLKNFFKWLKF